MKYGVQLLSDKSAESIEIFEFNNFSKALLFALGYVASGGGLLLRMVKITRNGECQILTNKEIEKLISKAYRTFLGKHLEKRGEKDE